MTYQEQLKSPLWQKKRLEILQRDNWSCYECKETKKTLHVHHKKYIYGNMAWEYENCDLVTLCQSCHSLEEEYKKISIIKMYADASGQSCVNIVKLISIVSFIKVTNQPKYKSIISELNTVFDTPSEFENFLNNPHSYGTANKG